VQLFDGQVYTRLTAVEDASASKEISHGAKEEGTCRDPSSGQAHSDKNHEARASYRCQASTPRRRETSSARCG
jgi:hypothetical protein